MTRALLVLTLLLAVPRPAPAAEWANIAPGVSTLEQVRETFGKPSKEVGAKVEGYDTVQWIYERSQAPEGLIRMIVDFGLLTPAGYKPSVVRLLTLEPNQFIFGRQTVIEGWGLPDGVGKGEDTMTFFYREGLFVLFEKEGRSALKLIFSVPQPETAEKSAPPAPSSAPPKQ